jgi:hypothetical protein
MARDDWIDDERILAEITQREDYVGEWWNVPLAHLRQCMMALSYLDARGIAFYLPAYMSAVVEKPESFDSIRCCSSWQVICLLSPSEDPGLKQYFLDRFSMIRGGRRRVCGEFLEYVAACDAYDEYARRQAAEALAHGFWSSWS